MLFDYKSCYFFLILTPLILFFNLIFVIIYFFTAIFDYNSEDLYLDAIDKLWNSHPIYNISLEKLDGYIEIEFLNWNKHKTFCDCTHYDGYSRNDEGICYPEDFINGCNQYNSSKIAYIIYNSKLYASYYPENYWTLYERIEKDPSKQSRGLCKKEKINGKNKWKRCGYMDSFNNSLCVKNTEECPISGIFFNFDQNNNLISLNTTNKAGTKIINQIMISEIRNPNIYDINKIYTLDDINNHEQISDVGDEALFPLLPLKTEKNDQYKIYKPTFFEQNNLIEGDIPDWFKDKYMYLYHMEYPPNSVEYPLDSKNLKWIRKSRRISLKSIILICNIYCCLFFYFQLKTQNCKKLEDNIIKFEIVNIIFFVLLFIFTIINIIFLEGEYRLLSIINKLKKKNELDDHSVAYYSYNIIHTILLFMIIVNMIVFIVKDIYCYIKKKKEEKIEKEEEEEEIKEKGAFSINTNSGYLPMN